MQRKSRPRLKFGIVGVGHMGAYHLNVVSSLPSHELIGIYEVNPERAREMAERYDTVAFESLESLFKEVEAVVIAVPTSWHYELARQALESGVHVLLEKPMTDSLEKAEALISLAAERGLVLQVGHVERFNGAVMELAKIVTNPRMIQSRRLSPYNGRVQDVGVVMDLLIHDLDIVLNLVKSPLKYYHAMGSRVISEHEDVAILNLEFENGCIASLTASRISQLKDRSLQILQDRSFINLNYINQDIEIHRQASAAYLMTPEEIKYSQESFVEKLYVHKDNPLKSEHLHFYECIKEGARPIVSSEQDLQTLRIALECEKMILEGRPCVWN
ncbi:MAG: Gfo/Idh/MocA family oxidoreductase [Leptospiraceae bacterium]|nr:Gfo/Idh/MocA family oxidoreductase [Leptospiraceae bacterium]MDW8305991.1 Gfo/Idh/MocA family oxidoreductase [Leptospiraceae bacterium]